jgi:uncharacterized RmlC-like cupin family protein
MRRLVGIDMASAAAERIFLGYGIAPGHTHSAAHHHGEAETAVYCLKGRQRVYFGEGYDQFIEFGEGEYAFIPPHVPHVEVNLWEEAYEGIIARSPSNIVVNLEDRPEHLFGDRSGTAG